MRYWMRIQALGCGKGVEIEPEEYFAIISSVRRIEIATEIEEKLDLLLENFFEYESELLSFALRNSLSAPLDQVAQIGHFQAINRRVLNLLSTAKSYIDQSQHEVKEYFGCEDPELAQLRGALSAQYDQHLEYRVAEALRNYSQHRSLPVDFVTMSSEWELLDEEGRRLRHWVVPKILIKRLLEDPRLKSKLKKELRPSAEQQWPLTPILRRYVESLGAVHEIVREMLEGNLAGSRLVLQKAVEKARVSLSERTTGLAVAAETSEGAVEEECFFNERRGGRLEFLRAKNRFLGNLSRRYVSGEPPGHRNLESLAR